MNKTLKFIFILLFIPLIIVSFIRSEFKETKRNSKRIAEAIKTYHMANNDSKTNYEFFLKDFDKLKSYLTENNFLQ